MRGRPRLDGLNAGVIAENEVQHDPYASGWDDALEWLLEETERHRWSIAGLRAHIRCHIGRAPLRQGVNRFIPSRAEGLERAERRARRTRRRGAKGKGH